MVAGAEADVRGDALVHGPREAAHRHLVRSIAYCSPDDRERFGAALAVHDIDCRGIADPAQRAVAFACDAMALSPRVDTVVLIPGDDPALRPLRTALDAQGVRVETADFSPPSADADDGSAAGHRELGEDCIFVP